MSDRNSIAYMKGWNDACTAHRTELSARDLEISRLNALVRSVIVDIERRLKSDEACNHPFDEDLADALERAEKEAKS